MTAEGYKLWTGLLDFFEQRARFEGGVRIERFLRHEDFLHHALAIDDERRPARDKPLFVEHAVRAADIPPCIAQHRELHPELLGKPLIGPDAVDAHAERHGIVLVELARGFLIL